MANQNGFGSMFDNALRRQLVVQRHVPLRMAKPDQDECGKCGTEIDPGRRIDFTLKDGTRVCDSCFVKGTARPTQISDGVNK
jgi:hypothetical protein